MCTSLQPGVGTFANPVSKQSLTTGVSLVMDQLFAYNLSGHIKGIVFHMVLCMLADISCFNVKMGIIFSCRIVSLNLLDRLVHSTSLALADVEGDKICILGYSRGAYIGRALAGMLHKVPLT